MKRARNEQAKDDRKEAILKCAQDLIIEKGLELINIKSIAQKANLSVGTIYLYYQNKEEIIAALTVKSRYVLLNSFKEASKGIANPLNKIEKTLWAYYEFNVQYPFYYELVSFYESNTGLKETEELQVASFLISSFVVDIMEEAKKQLLVAQHFNSLEFSFTLWGSASGVIQLINVKGKTIEETLGKGRAEFYQSFIDLIIKGLKEK